jgi:hypothetical protein
MAIYTGPGGNVRYIRADSVTRDAFFGGGLPEEDTSYQPGQVVHMVDDSGAAITITPQITGNNAFYNPNDPFSSGPYTGTAITDVVTYGIRGSGGSVLVHFNASGQFNMSANSSASGASAEVGTINVTGGNGNYVRLDASGNPVFIGAALNEVAATQDITTLNPGLNIGLNGSAQLDVLELNAGSLAVDNINSNGELPSVIAGTIGGIVAKRLGVTSGHWGVNVDPQQLPTGSTILPDTGLPSGVGQSSGTGVLTSTLGDVYPFNQQHTGIQSGNIISASSRENIGNFMVVGSIGSITANSDGSDNPSVFEGITGPIVVDGTGGISSSAARGLVYATGSVNNVQIGEGIRFSGSGAASRGGVYAQNHIGDVRNQGAGSDIRGDVVAGNSIASVVLNNGSIIGGQILQIQPSNSTSTGGSSTATTPDYSTAREGPYATFSGRLPATVNHVNPTIGEIRLPGNGGIIGSRFRGADIGPISAPGFGVLGSSFVVVINGTMGGITAGGYGIRAITIRGGNSTGQLLATGNGGEISTNAYGASVRQSELGLTVDPYSGMAISPMNDINAFLGTSAATPIVAGATESGVIQNVAAIGSRDFNGAKAWQIRGAMFNFANSIGSITTTSTISGLNVTTGKLKTFSPGSDVFNSSLVIAGPIDTIRINGSLTDGSTIQASGPNGTIKNISIANDLIGSVKATQRIGTITVGRNISGVINVASSEGNPGSLGSLFFGGTIANGSLDLYGNIGTITSGGSFGQSGDTLDIFGSLQKLEVRGDLRANVSVTDSANTIDVWGSILSGVTVGVDNTIGALLVGGDTQAGSVIRARLLNRVQVGGANLATYQIG